MSLKNWSRRKQKKIIQTPIFTLYETKWKNHTQNRMHTFTQLKTAHWAHVMAWTKKKKLVIIRQFRPGAEKDFWELPGGCIEKNESPQQCALRELKEETGYTPTPHAQIDILGWTHPNPAYQNNRCYSIWTCPVQKTTAPTREPGEDIQTLLWNQNTLMRHLKRQHISHALMLQAFYFWFLKKNPKLIL